VRSRSSTWCAALSAAGILTAAGSPRFELHNARVRVVLSREEDVFVEKWYARDGEKWRLVMTGGNAERASQTIGTGGGVVAVPFTGAGYARVREGGGGDRALEIYGMDGTDRITKTIRLEEGSPFASVTVTMSVTAPREVSALLSTYSFTPDGRAYAAYAPLDFVFTPTLRPEPDEVIADHVFRSPALIMQKGSVAAALVPDVRTIDGKNRPLRAGADLQVTTYPFMSFGLLNWKRAKEHVFYVHRDTMVSRIGPGDLSYGYRLYVNAQADAREAYRDIVRFEWSEYGKGNFLDPAGPQSEPFAAYVHKAWYEYMPSVALDTVYNGVPVTLLRQGRLAWSNGLPKSADNDTWFNVWFNALRTAYGMHMEGVASGDSALARRAERVLNLALQAPRGGDAGGSGDAGGLAPTIFYVDSAGGHWVADQGWGGINAGASLQMFHNAWTAYWMLAWGDRVPARRPEIASYTKGIAGFLVAHQLPTGVIPSWYDPVTGVPDTTLRDENAETAGAALFLADYAGRTGDRRAREAAERAMRYVLTAIVPERKWFDFETFFSCSRKPVGFFDRVTCQHPQNTLSMQMAAEACARLYELTGRRSYLDEGSAILDYLCLYQQVWSPAWLSCRLFGGFGVQNTDGEWSDSRQGYFALTLVKYYELTGRREYFERGVAALRAMFSLFESPASPRTNENYGHGGYDGPTAVTGLHWGTGSSVVSIHLITAKYGGAYIDVGGGWGAGIDGCRIPDVTVSGKTVRFVIDDNVGVRRSVAVTFGGMAKGSYTIIANGKSLGRFDASLLAKGIDVQI